MVVQGTFLGSDECEISNPVRVIYVCLGSLWPIHVLLLRVDGWE